MKAVADSTTLIYLAKIGRLGLLTGYYEVFIPGAVYDEVVERGVAKGFPDALIIRRAVEKGEVKVEKLDPEGCREAQELKRFANIGAGEAEAITLAKFLKAELIIDDALAHGVARTFAIKPLWTTSFILKLFSEGVIGKEEAREILEELVEAGYWVGEDVLLKLLRKLE
ncbi:MAG: hypothetical protein GXO66_06710 [Euryarchaeota archaeon]|nr:hypothetical protein [Euryarchaeota archaeon]